MKSLRKIYNIYYDVLNTKDYGIPQNRERLYIIGINKKNQIKKFEFPETKKMKDIKKFIDYNDNSVNNITNSIKNTLSKINKDAVFVDWSHPNNTYPNANKWCPTITTNNTLWCVPKKRKANSKERLKLQDFPENFKQVVSDTQFNKQIGNTMSVNVLQLLLKECLICMY